eukprot:g10894.t1
MAASCWLETQASTLEEKRVYTYQLAPRTQVRVDREDLTQVYSSYLCADCGTELRLSRAIRCGVASAATGSCTKNELR